MTERRVTRATALVDVANNDRQDRISNAALSVDVTNGDRQDRVSMLVLSVDISLVSLPVYTGHRKLPLVQIV